MDPTVAYRGGSRVEFNSPSFHKSSSSSHGDAAFVRSPSISSTCLSSDPSSSSLPSSPSDDLCEDDGEFSIRSALALYQAFYDHCGDNRASLNNNLTMKSNENNNVVLKQMKGRQSDFEDGADDEENGIIESYAARRTLDEQFNQTSFDPVDEGTAAHRSSNCDVVDRDSGEASSDDSEEEEDRSVTSVHLTPPNISDPVYQRGKKIGKVLLSIIALWAYSRYHQSKQEQLSRRRGIRNNIRREGTILQVIQWMFRLVSPTRILNYLQLFRPTIKSMESIPRSSWSLWKNATHVPFGHLVASARAGDVTKVILRGSALAYLHSTRPSSSSSQTKQQQRWSRTTISSAQNSNALDEIIATLLDKGCEDITTLPESMWHRFLHGPAVMTLPFAYLMALYWMMRRLQRQQFQDDDNGGGHGGKSNGGILWNGQCYKTTFDDVAGIDSSMQELSEIVSYARNPSAFREVGARPPRGILLYGVPGCGKTLLARAIAGEANRDIDGVHRVGGNAVDCFAVCSGSEFVDTYVGRGAARVRTLFHNVREEAKRNFRRRHGGRERVARYAADPVSDRLVGGWESIKSTLGMTDLSKKDDDSHRRPMAIIFIDEIDCLAKRRDGSGFSSSLGGGCDEREQTLNQLLTELDGFETGAVSSDGVDVIIIAATNRPEVLDPALMRPGRFDRHVRISLPDARGRDAILRVHARHIRWDHSSVDFSLLSKATQGFSGADLKNVINEAALLAVRSGCLMVEQIHLLEAVQKVRANLSA